MAEFLGIIFVLILIIFGKRQVPPVNDVEGYTTEGNPVLDPKKIGSGVNIYDETLDELFHK